MPELLIMRHAKSDWGVGLSSDRERPLSRRGTKAAKRMGRFLTKTGCAPEIVLSSPAVRAQTTAELAAQAGKWKTQVEIVRPFYGGAWSDVVDGVLARTSTEDRVLVVGHEPTWSDLVSVLTEGGHVGMPTAAVACVSVIGSSWSKLGPGCGELQWLMTPRLLKPIF